MSKKSLLARSFGVAWTLAEADAAGPPRGVGVDPAAAGNLARCAVVVAGGVCRVVGTVEEHRDGCLVGAGEELQR